MEPIYRTEIKEIGPEVPEFLEMGLLITFAVGAPPELSVLHEPTHRRPGARLEIRAGARSAVARDREGTVREP